MEERVEFPGRKGNTFFGVLRVPRSDGKFPAVLICHGFLENMQQGLIADIANGLSYYGFVTLRFDFTYGGGGYEEVTLNEQVEDIRDAVEYLKTIPQVDTRRIILLGHDLGGVACLLADHKDIDGIVLVNVRVNTKAFITSFITEYDLNEWMSTGWMDIMGVRLRKEFYESMIKADVIDEIKDEKVPILILHGTNDKRCPYEDARTLFQSARNAHLELIEGADHNFSDPEQRMYIINYISDWISKILGT